MKLFSFVTDLRRKMRRRRRLRRELADLEQWQKIGRKVRLFASHRYLRGEGIEIGALHRPLQLYHRARVRYIDRHSSAELRRDWPAVADQPMVEVDQVEDAETLGSLANESCDFVIANHVIEHLENPIGAIENMLRVLKWDGILYLAVPDKRFTFDRDRPSTSYEHVRRDYMESPDWSRAGHYQEWLRDVGKLADETGREKRAAAMQAQHHSIHFHVWTQRDFIELILGLSREFHFPIEIESIAKNSQELVVVLRKTTLE